MAQISKDVTLTLVEENNFNEVDIDLDVAIAGASNDTSTLTGTIEVRVNVTPDLSSTSELTILSADVSGSDISLSRRILFTTLYSLTGEDLRFSAETISPPGLFNVANGEFDASQHEITVNQGTFSGSAVGADDIEFNFSDEPFVGQGADTGTVLITPGRIEDRELYFDVIVELPAIIDETIDEAGVEADIEIQGSIKAAGGTFIEIPNYATWATRSNVAITTKSEDNYDLNPSHPNFILFSLGFDRQNSPNQLFDFSSTGTTLKVEGLHAAESFEIQWSNDLNTWERVPNTSMINGKSAFDFGDSLSHEITVSNRSPKKYLRVASVTPN